MPRANDLPEEPTKTRKPRSDKKYFSVAEQKAGKAVHDSVRHKANYKIRKAELEKNDRNYL